MNKHLNPNRNNFENGRFDAELFLQSLADHGDVMTDTEAGAAFSQAVCEQMCAAANSATARGSDALGADVLRFQAFLTRIGEALYWQAEKEREERSAFSFDSNELRRLIVHAHETADKALGDFENHVVLIDTVAAVVNDLRLMALLIGVEGIPCPVSAGGKQVAKVISLAIASAAKKGGAA